MEDQLVQLLSATQAAQETPRKHAEQQLLSLYGRQELPLGLVGIACHDGVPLNTRQAALLCLKQLVLAGWSSNFDEFKGSVLVTDANKVQIRQRLLELATTDRLDRKLKSAAGLVVSKIAGADYPDQWPDLLDSILRLIPVATDGQLHGALKVLSELVEDCFSEAQFFAVAPQLVKVVFDVAVNEQRKPMLRAFACSVFRACFDTLEMVLEDHKAAVKGFADEILQGWLPFFVAVMQTRLPAPPAEQDESDESPAAELYKGMVALKLQVVKVLMRVRSIFPSQLSPHSLVLFQATWEELSALQPAYTLMYIEEERQSRLEDADGLPYTLDFLVLEELDFMQACLRAPPVRAQLEQELQNQTPENSWVTEVMKLAVAYAQITTEEEGLWDIDVNIFLSEETSVTANYTPRTACGDLVIKLGEWLTEATIDGLLTYTRALYSAAKGWQAKEAALFVLNQMLGDFQEVDKQISPEAASGFVDFVRYAMQQPDVFLRARGYLVAGSLTRTSGNSMQQLAPSFLEAALQAITTDESDVVQVSCIRSIQHYLQALPREVTHPVQSPIITAIGTYLAAQDLQELAESDDLTVTLVETLRDAILLDPRICISGDGQGLDLLFRVASHCANNFQLALLVNETFEEVTEYISQVDGGAGYVSLCAKVLPSLTGAFDIGNLTEENALTTLAADLLNILAEQGPEPLPAGFVATTMPKLQRLLLESTDEELLKSATMAVKNILAHDHQQLFQWQDNDGKVGLEVILLIISRLLSATSDHAAAEVGSLAAEVVEKAGHERLGPYLEDLLRSVAVRLSTAEHAPFIQSLTLVFARLSLNHASEVVEFLARQDIGGQNGLQVVLAKWLENSINFAGYDEIRQNVIALSKLYDLKDPRLTAIQVKGDLIPNTDGRIMTRSRARVNPDQYTFTPATLKILKVLIVELQSASGASLDASAAAELADEADSDDGDWEDEANPFVDLGSGFSREQLMAFADETPGQNRQRDDETQAFLVEFFKRAAAAPGFAEEFAALSEEERQRLRDCAA